MGKRYLPLLLVLFAGSGCSALIYEIVWFQLLELVIGASAVSLAVLLGTFMGGLCLGSLAFPRLVSPRLHPLRVYASLELATGVLALGVLAAVPRIGGLYTMLDGGGIAGLALRGVLCAVCLLPPTVLMGATLPAIARWIGASRPQEVSWLGVFYGGNIAGAVFGCLLAGFYLLRVHDIATATYVAFFVNAGAAAVALDLADRASSDRAAAAPRSVAVAQARDAAAVYVAIALSGFAALGAEVVWTRLLSLMLGATVYAFSIILAVFLVGLGVGSGVGSSMARSTRRPRSALAVCQLLLAPAIAWTAYALARTLPYWSIDAVQAARPWYVFRTDLARTTLAILPATCLWGASFPLALAAVASDSDDPGRLVGRVYAANTIGAIAGAIGISMAAVPLLGTARAEQVLIAASVAAAMVVGWSASAAPSPEAPADSGLPGAGQSGSRIAFAALCLAALAMTRLVAAVPPALIAYGRTMPTSDVPRILYTGEGMNASVAVSELTSGVRNFHVSGKVEASTEPQDMRLQRMLANLPALVHPDPRSVLVVGFGAGVTAGSFVPYRAVQRIVICEIEPLIPRDVAPFFAVENYHVLDDPRAHLVVDDARHFVLTTNQRFDIITSDPIHPWVKGAATLYTREYFEQVKRHLNPGGLVTQWVPLYESNPDVVRSELATFFQVFPNGTVWGNTSNGEGYDVVLVGQAGPVSIDVDALQRRLERPEYRAVAASLAEVGFGSAVDLLATYAGQASDLAPWLAGAAINRDRNLRLQYLAGLGLNEYESGAIYSEMLLYRRFPGDLFVGSGARTRQLWDALGRPPAEP
ncbi:MAG: fused MFS/spermidine synthase [Betaproteobacteria bacterium]